MATNTTTSSDSRSDEEGDWIAQQFFSPADLQLSPEEYAARHAHLLGAYSFHLFRYRDPVLGAWVRRVGEILATEGEVDRLRKRLLSPEDLAVIQKQQAEGY